MKIAITGASGHLGRLAVEALKARTDPANLVALARNPAAVRHLGVTAREFDYDHEETLAPGLEGVEALLLISGNDLAKRVEQHRRVIAAAKAAGVKRVVYTSVLRADTSTLAVAPDHRATEAMIREFGLDFTILRNGWYTENYTETIPATLGGGALLGNAGDAKFSLAARADYARAAAVVLTEPGHEGKTYELAGDEAVTLTDVAAEISRQTGREIPYKNLSESEYADVLESNGLPKDVARFVASLDTGAARGDLFDDGHALSRLIGRPTTPLSKSVAEVLAPD